MRIRDARLGAVLSAQRVKSFPDEGVLPLLASLADSDVTPAAVLLDQLAQSTRAQQLALVAAGLDDEERQDVADLLDGGDHVFTPSTRNFLEALVGRAALQDGLAALPVTVRPDATLEGTLLPGSTVEAVNLSTAPAMGRRAQDAVEIGKTDAWGRFQAALPGVQGGDVVRMQTRNDAGRVTSWLNVRVQQQGGWDARAAFVDLSRLTMTPRPDGNVDIQHLSRVPLTEPGAQLRFTNLRTGTFSDVTADANGRIPPIRLAGQSGDAVSVAVSDGAGNWGTGEPGYDGKDDGIFKLPVEKFIQLYQVLNVC